MPPKFEAFLPKAPPAPSSDRLALDGWLDDGGSVRPNSARPVRKPRSSKQLADTVIGCRSRASADLVAAAAMTTKNGQLRMEASSASWTARADLLQRMEDDFSKRLALKT